MYDKFPTNFSTVTSSNVLFCLSINFIKCNIQQEIHQSHTGDAGTIFNHFQTQFYKATIG